MRAGFEAHVEGYAAMTEARRKQVKAAMQQQKANADHHLAALAKAEKQIRKQKTDNANRGPTP